MPTSIDRIESTELEKLITELKTVLNFKSGDPNGSTYQSLRKLNAKCLFEAERNVEAVYNLVESLAPSVRTMAQYRAERSYSEKMKINKLVSSDHLNAEFNKLKKDVKNSDDMLTFLSNTIKSTESKTTKSDPVDVKMVHLNKDFIKHVNEDPLEITKMQDKINELPKEWTVIQLTAGYEPSEQWQNLRTTKASVKDFYLTVLKNDSSMQKMDPITVQIVPENVKYGEKPLFEELYSTLEENLQVIENNLRVTSNSLAKYWEKRNECDLRMKSMITTMDRKWLNGWKSLLMGQIVSKELNDRINSLIKQFSSTIKLNFSATQKMLLFNLLSASHHVSSNEISLLLRKIYIEHGQRDKNTGCKKCQKKTLNGLCIQCENNQIAATPEYKHYRKSFMDMIEAIKNDSELKGLRHTKRGPLILLIDEKLDKFPWEVLPILSNSPVTRLECLGFAYALFKNHENNMRDGYYQLKPTIGRFLINPGGDLHKMEKRMSSFINYWCPQWEGENNTLSSQDVFEKYLREADVLLYCGHGDGAQYIGIGAERLENIKSTAILSGCGSVSLRYPGPRFLPIPIHSHLHFATCPSVIGMLWEVTDLEVDKVTSMLISLFVPSKAPKHWGYVGKSQWTKGILGPNNTEESGKFNLEPDLLKALTIARRSSSFVMIAASIVARGLPIRILPEYEL